MTYADIVVNFANRKNNPRHNEVVWGSKGNVYSDKKTLFSYGGHFPLAVYLGKDAETHVFLKNRDNYSSSTSYHQGLANICYGPKVSNCLFSSVHKVNIQNLTLENLLFWQKQIYTTVYQDIITYKFYKNIKQQYTTDLVPHLQEKTGKLFKAEYGAFQPSKQQWRFKTNRFVIGHWIAPEIVGIEYKKKFYISYLWPKNVDVINVKVKPTLEIARIAVDEAISKPRKCG